MKMRAEPWILLTIALALANAMGCGDDGVTTPRGDDDDDEVTEPSTGDDDSGDDDADDDDDISGDDDDSAPTVDAGMGRKDSGTSRPPTRGAPDAGKDDGKVDATTGSGSDATKPTPAGDAGTPSPAPDASTPPAGGERILPAVDSVDKDGPFKPTIDTMPNFVVFRPAELGMNGLKHPVFVWGTGSGALPERYNDHFNRMASHGFVIISPNKTQKSASDMKAALDYILAENMKSGSPLYQKLDPDRVAMGGHSQGSVSTFDAAATETRIKTTIHIAGGSFDGQGSSKIKTPTAYICGETDFALENCKRDFMNVKDQPTFFSELKGVDHVQCARSALPGMIAWLRWHLAGETERAAMFTGPDGEYFKGIWKSQTKNWK